MRVILDRNFSGKLSRDINDYPDGIVVLIDKPYRWTSADVIRKVKYAAIRHFNKKNLKVGHAGTLDPLATGVLLVCIGNACKDAEKYQASGKEYIAGVSFGATTASYDLEKEIDRYFPSDAVSRESIEAILPSFIGEQEQVAPLFSAKMVDGKRAYEIARQLYRQGEDVQEANERAGAIDEAAGALLRVGHINIERMDLLDYYVTEEEPQESPNEESGASGRINVEKVPAGLKTAIIRVSCSKGTYIRALARDLGESLGSGAFLSSLQRKRSGTFDVRYALSVDQVIDLFE